MDSRYFIAVCLSILRAEAISSVFIALADLLFALFFSTEIIFCSQDGLSIQKRRFFIL
jgi:hypothetical protein